MTLYVLSGSVDWENYDIYGVYSSVDAAKNAAEPIIEKLGGRHRLVAAEWQQHGPFLTIAVQNNGDSLVIEEHELDAPAVTRRDY